MRHVAAELRIIARQLEATTEEDWKAWDRFLINHLTKWEHEEYVDEYQYRTDYIHFEFRLPRKETEKFAQTLGMTVDELLDEQGMNDTIADPIGHATSGPWQEKAKEIMGLGGISYMTLTQDDDTEYKVAMGDPIVVKGTMKDAGEPEYVGEPMTPSQRRRFEWGESVW